MLTRTPADEGVGRHVPARRRAQWWPLLVGAAVIVVATTSPGHPVAAVAAVVALEGNHPIGSVEVAQSPEPGALVVTGWAVDPDTDAPVDVRVEVQGSSGSAPLVVPLGPAGVERPEIAASFAGIGDRHGFDARLDLPEGFTPTGVTVHAVNAAGTPGADQVIGSVPIDPELDPFGSLESITATPDGYVRIRGWTADPSGSDPLLTVWIGPKFVWASGSGVHHPLPELLGYGDRRGFDTRVGGPPYFSPGTHEICVRIGFRVGLGCRTVTIVEDRFAPETVLTRVPPASGSDPAVAIEFTSSEFSQFGCRWGLGEWSPCRSPVVATVAPGTYTFAVRSSDHWGNTDQTPATTTFTVTGPPPGRLVVRAEAVRHRSRLRVDVDPDSLEHNYRFRVQRRVDDRWRTVARRSTRGLSDVRLLDLDRGRYRVVVPAQHGMLRDVARARLRR